MQVSKEEVLHIANLKLKQDEIYKDLKNWESKRIEILTDK